MAETASTASVASETDALKSGTKEAELWLKKIKAQKDAQSQWVKDAREAEKIYESDAQADVQFNVLFSNTETLVPALYNSSPVPDVRRRFGDADPLSKQVVDLTERLLSESCDAYDIDHHFKAAVKDAAVAGRGVLRVRYEPIFGPPMKDPSTGEMFKPKAGDRTYCERVPWDKYIEGPSRTWEEVPWVAFELDLTKEEIIKLNAAMAQELSGGAGSETKNVDETSKDPKGILITYRAYEVWDKVGRRVLFILEKDKDRFLAQLPDPLGLPNFLPVLRPLQPAERLSSRIPLCPYNAVKYLVEELQTITKRIDKLIRQLRVRGLYDGELEADVNALSQCDDGQYEAAKNAALFASQGGLEKAVAHWPMEPTVMALQQLYAQRDQVRALIDQIAGVSDLQRGHVDPREKLGQSQLKNQWGSIRVQDQQAAVAMAARELFRAKAHIFATKYSEQSIKDITGMPFNDEQAQAWPQIYEAFRDKNRSYRIDIETDSTIRADMTRNQEQMNQFLAGTAQFVQAMTGLITIPSIGQAALPTVVEVFTAFARKFKLGKQAEDALDKLSTTVQQASQQPQQEQPDPAAEKAKVEIQALQQRSQIEAQGMQMKAANDQQAMQLEAKSLEMKAGHEERMMQLREREAQLKLQITEIELETKRQSAAIDGQAKLAAVAHADKMNTIKANNAQAPKQ